MPHGVAIVTNIYSKYDPIVDKESRYMEGIKHGYQGHVQELDIYVVFSEGKMLEHDL